MPNHIESETSPYLSQQKKSPVDWYPWCDEAFEKAKRENKPVFLNIGYSTCRPCHIMTEECFYDSETANILNRCYISINVDREERPDIDRLYSAVCQELHGKSGWPLNVFLTPDRTPFHITAFLQKNSDTKRTGLIELLREINYLWKFEREELIEASNNILERINHYSDIYLGAKPAHMIFESAMDSYLRCFDYEYGGFGAPPKFPMPHQLIFLTDYYSKKNDLTALMMVARTLSGMYQGSIFDHISGGFFRYSNDRQWLEPCFEKNLSDNALLLYAYAAGYEAIQDEAYLKVINKTVMFLLNDMRDERGGIYCASSSSFDASDGEYYLISPREAEFILGKEKAEEFCKYYNINETSIFGDKSLSHITSNINPPSDIDALTEIMDRYRHSRSSLKLDKKILTFQNSLAIFGLAKAFQVTGIQQALSLAQGAHAFIDSHMWKCGRLMHSSINGEAAYEGQLEDYAFYALALLELYRATNDAGYLSDAQYAAALIPRIFASDEMGFKRISKNEKTPLQHEIDIYDADIPSGNSAAALLFAELFKETKESAWQTLARKQLVFLSSAMKEPFTAYAFALFAMLYDSDSNSDKI